MAATHWNATIRMASTVLSVASTVPAPLITVPNKLARAVLGNDVLPLWSPELPTRGGRRARPAPAAEPEAVYVPACVKSMFGAVGDDV